MFTPSHRADDSTLLHFRNHDPVHWIDAQAFGRGVAEGTHRREWTWLAVLDGRPVARGAWWGPVGAVHPIELRCLIVEPSVPHPEVWGAALIRSAHRAFAEAGALLAPDFVVTVDAARRDEPEVVQALAWRRRAAVDAGLTVRAERAVGGEALQVVHSARPVPATAPALPVLSGSGR